MACRKDKVACKIKYFPGKNFFQATFSGGGGVIFLSVLPAPRPKRGVWPKTEGEQTRHSGGMFLLYVTKKASSGWAGQG